MPSNSAGDIGGDIGGKSADLVYRLAWMKQTGNVYVTGDDPEGTNDGLARRTAPRIGTYAMRRCWLGMCSGCAAREGCYSGRCTRMRQSLGEFSRMHNGHEQCGPSSK